MRWVVPFLFVLLGSACGDGSSPESPTWETAFDVEDAGWLLSVWGTGADDVWAVGGTEDEGAAFHHDGDDWESVELPDDTPLLNWVHGFSEDDVTLVGNEGVVLHYDGDEWTQQDTPTEQDLWGVWGESPDELWAVGGRGRSDGEATLLFYDGASWQLHELPPLERSGVNALFKVWGSSREDVYAVGQRGGVIHYDGDEWSERLVGASDDLISVWGTGRNNVVAVGGRGRGIISVWDGDEWTTESLSPISGLNGVWLNSKEQAYIGGANGTVASVQLDDFTVEERVVDTNLDVHGIFAVGKRLYAVGGNFFGPVPPYEGIAVTTTLY
jgi:hypothetical protein